MNKIIPIALALLILLAACTPSPTSTQAATLPSQPAKPAATSTPVPPTSTPTQPPTSTPVPIPVSTPLPMHAMGETIQCGSLFYLIVQDIPIFTSYPLSSKASGAFLFVRPNIKYAGDRALDSMDVRSFSLSGEVDGKTVSYPFDQAASSEYARTYGLSDTIFSQVTPNKYFVTEVVFDVNPSGTNWVFHFTPYISPVDQTPACSVDVALVK